MKIVNELKVGQKNKAIPIKEIMLTDEERFLKCIDTEDNNHCQQYKGRLNKDGYGFFDHKGTVIGAHRFAYMLKYGEIPKDKEVCHTCDNPGCVNTEHLFLGTHTENMIDMFNKGRGNRAKGERVGSAKKTKEEVNEIRKKYNSNRMIKHSDLAKEYGISQSEIRYILSNKNWKDDNYKPVHRSGKGGESHQNAKRTWTIINSLRNDYLTKNFTLNELSKKYNIPLGTVGNIVLNNSWKDEEYKKRLDERYYES